MNIRELMLEFGASQPLGAEEPTMQWALYRKTGQTPDVYNTEVDPPELVAWGTDILSPIGEIFEGDEPGMVARCAALRGAENDEITARPIGGKLTRAVYAKECADADVPAPDD